MHPEITELVRSLLLKRGIIEDKDIAAFLKPDYDTHTHSPLLLHDIGIAVKRILQAIDAEERIAVYADFDCDGIPGASVLSDFFEKIGYANIEVYLPHRDREGYGFHTEAITELAGRGVKLIITVDVGTAALDAVLFAKNLGVDVIVTDHHEILGELPKAVAVLNPKIVPPASSGIERYPFPHLCGAAMAFKLVQALLIEGKKQERPEFLAVPEGWEKWLLDLVAIATVADMVQLIGENRTLVYWGLQVLRKSPRPGIIALCNALRLKRSELSEDDIGFSIAPRINAASRMGEPALALLLLTTKDSDEAESLAAQLEKLNASRKGVVSGIVREAKKHARERFTKDDEVIVMGNPEWKPALLGLAANSVMGERGGIVCLWGRDALGRLKGSCRSDGARSVVELFARSGDALIEYGGHEASGGFSVSSERVHTLHEELARVGASMERVDVSPESTHDALITLREVSMSLLKDISRLAPFGKGNSKPIFRIAGAKIVDTKRFGKEKNHIEVSLVCASTGRRSRAFDFFRGPDDFSTVPSIGLETAMLATVESDAYRGGLVLRLVDVLPV